MAFALGDLFDLYGQAVTAKQLGPDWQQKRAQSQADIASKQASIGEAQARTKNLEIQGEQNRFDLDEATRTRNTLEKLAANDPSFVPELKAFDATMKHHADQRAAAEEGRKAQQFPLTMESDQAKLANEKGQFDHEERLAHIRAKEAAGNAIGATITLWRDGKWVTLDKRTGQPVEGSTKAPGDVEQQSEKIAQSVHGALQRMTEIGGKVTAGPLMGNLSKLGQSTFGPSGPEGEFDALAAQLPNMVYVLSGKQINAQELARLSVVTPNRSKGHMENQIKNFVDYANRLLTQYGQPPIEYSGEPGFGGTPAVAAPSTPPGTPPGTGVRVISIKKVP